jgi:hypothetical protein
MPRASRSTKGAFSRFCNLWQLREQIGELSSPDPGDSSLLFRTGGGDCLAGNRRHRPFGITGSSAQSHIEVVTTPHPCDGEPRSMRTDLRRVDDHHHSVPAGLVGWEQDLEILQSFAARASVSGGGLVVAGDPGFGKTTLLDAVAVEAATAGTKVLRAAGVECEAGISYARRATTSTSSPG